MKIQEIDSEVLLETQLKAGYETTAEKELLVKISI